jgi:hypothetical protein
MLDELSGGVHPGFKPAHAKGLMCKGTFSPASEAAGLTRAPHATRRLEILLLGRRGLRFASSAPNFFPQRCPNGCSLFVVFTKAGHRAPPAYAKPSGVL